MVVQSRFRQVINFLKGVNRLSLKGLKQTEHGVEQSPPAYSADEKNPPQQSSAQLTIQVLGNSARILLEGREAIARTVESEKALLKAGDEKMKQSLLAYGVDEKNTLQQSSAQVTIQVLGNSARILLEGREAIARTVESEKALLNVEDKTMI
jgi:hypothetical protein